MWFSYSLTKIPVFGFRAHSNQAWLVWTKYILKDPIFKSGHILRCGVDTNCGGGGHCSTHYRYLAHSKAHVALTKTREYQNTMEYKRGSHLSYILSSHTYMQSPPRLVVWTYYFSICQNLPVRYLLLVCFYFMFLRTFIVLSRLIHSSHLVTKSSRFSLLHISHIHSSLSLQILPNLSASH